MKSKKITFSKYLEELLETQQRFKSFFLKTAYIVYSNETEDEYEVNVSVNFPVSIFSSDVNDLEEIKNEIYAILEKDKGIIFELMQQEEDINFNEADYQVFDIIIKKIIEDKLNTITVNITFYFHKNK